METRASTQCQVQVAFGRKAMKRDEAEKLRPAAVVELDAFADDYVDVYADGQLIARGRPVVVDGKLGVKIQEAMVSRMLTCPVPWNSDEV